MSASSSGGDSTHLNAGFLSPLAQGSSDQKQFTFSPSIFLSRPEESSNPFPQHARPASLFGNSRQGGIGSAPVIPHTLGPLSPSSESDGGLGEEFVTSTPIKSNKENLHGAGGRQTEGGGGGGGGWSPSILQTSGARRQFLKETNDVRTLCKHVTLCVCVCVHVEFEPHLVYKLELWLSKFLELGPFVDMNPCVPTSTLQSNGAMWKTLLVSLANSCLSQNSLPSKHYCATSV